MMWATHLREVKYRHFFKITRAQNPLENGRKNFKKNRPRKSGAFLDLPRHKKVEGNDREELRA